MLSLYDLKILFIILMFKYSIIFIIQTIQPWQNSYYLGKFIILLQLFNHKFVILLVHIILDHLYMNNIISFSYFIIKNFLIFIFLPFIFSTKLLE